MRVGLRIGWLGCESGGGYLDYDYDRDILFPLGQVYPHSGKYGMVRNGLLWPTPSTMTITTMGKRRKQIHRLSRYKLLNKRRKKANHNSNTDKGNRHSSETYKTR